MSAAGGACCVGCSVIIITLTYTTNPGSTTTATFIIVVTISRITPRAGDTPPIWVRLGGGLASAGGKTIRALHEHAGPAVSVLVTRWDGEDVRAGRAPVAFSVRRGGPDDNPHFVLPRQTAVASVGVLRTGRVPVAGSNGTNSSCWWWRTGPNGIAEPAGQDATGESGTGYPRAPSRRIGSVRADGVDDSGGTAGPGEDELAEVFLLLAAAANEPPG